MMNPYLSWALLLVVAGGLGWYYNGANPKTAVKPIAEKFEHTPSVKKPKKKSKKAPEPTPSSKVEEKPAPQPTPETEKPDEEIDQKEMAKRFAAVKNGTPQTSNKSTKSQKKAKKAVAQRDAEINSGSRTASTNGADADDDLSSTEYPAPASGSVSDMLEAPAPGASVLRVTGSMESEPKKQKAQSFKQVETKKQRQQRLKNEARKEQVQAAEAERRKLLEKQLHTARESERREAAKTKPAAPTTNAWQSNGASGASKPAQVPKVDLLDTFDSADSAPSTKNGSAESKKWTQSLPSEEEQMRILGAGQDEWTTVPSKKQPKKKGSKADESQSDASASESQPAPEVAPAVQKPKVTVTPTYIPAILRSQQKGHPLDSDWAA